MDPTADHDGKKSPDGDRSAGYAPYPKLTPEDVAPPPAAATTMPPESNPYVVPSAAPSSSKSLRNIGERITRNFHISPVMYFKAVSDPELRTRRQLWLQKSL
ncbi:hypothetical protein B296_00049190 [Ensete ventricosum]|uniref:Uncharacterized protein n=1 Tax=Ensete ventricosum TaxID=4639 RepID=A0A426XYS5_ENSVE|nr:hypothetical protein B296_00049190 [Ensete ventricosum]